MKGIVKFYDIRKGFGFIRGDDGHTIFVHKSAVPFFDIFLLPGEHVEYQVDNTEKGLQAVNLKKV
ncbi:MAG: cold-shock protein [Thermoplasmatales archaeon]|jgi:CspA family cold shock protein|nr:cold-shock protein [Thermoplasmatales archaeon]MCU0849984.1 cold shock domain-containing protein [Candidatus Thermoplasmatota archaeon]